MKINYKFPVIGELAENVKDAIKLKRLSLSIDKTLKSTVKPVFVYQMGKVGSTSIYESVRSAGLDAYHAHVLTYPKEKAIPRGFGFQIESGWLLRQKLIGSEMPIKIITLTRDPIARNISAYFHNLESICDQSGKVGTQALISVFLEKYQHEIPITWFDRELKAVTGIDSYAYDFNKNDGFVIIAKDNIELLILNVELANVKKEKILRDFLGCPEFELLDRNVASSKEYADQYAEFLKLIKLPRDYLENMLDSKYCRHFYSADAIASFHNKWIRN